MEVPLSHFAFNKSLAFFSEQLLLSLGSFLLLNQSANDLTKACEVLVGLLLLGVFIHARICFQPLLSLISL